MRRKILFGLLILLCTLLGYLFAWPVPIDPVAWDAPPNPGLTGAFAVNTALASAERLSVLPWHAPEDTIVDSQGRIYASMLEGRILRFPATGGAPEVFAETGGRPLGLAFDAQGNLIVADALRGLLSIDAAGKVTLLTDMAEDVPIRYADDLDIAADGRIFFSDASTKYGAHLGGSYEASTLDLNEHGGHGRLLIYDPRDGTTKVAAKGLQFANG
ncbi:MAG: SMP-30/gluconolactonase/LRE family protein, partial [Myxococcales bacterium]|nr:SMP-30/gluconolactonase/LRE family protein [Myxococcales bacterium]